MELQLPKGLSEITNIFYHYRDKAKTWKQNGEKLVIKDGNKIVAVFEPYDVVMTNNFVREQNKKYENLWLPTWALYKSGALKLYDERFQKTERGTIPLTKDTAKVAAADFVVEIDNAVIEDTKLEIDYKKLIGDIGENAVARFNRGVLSEDKFDPEKDGLINGHISFEVKTMRMIQKDKSFWMESSQWKKLDNVDLLYFIAIPEKVGELATGYLYYDTSVFNTVKHNGKILRSYPLTNCVFQFTIDTNDSGLLLEYSKQISTVERFT